MLGFSSIAETPIAATPGASGGTVDPILVTSVTSAATGNTTSTYSQSLASTTTGDINIIAINVAPLANLTDPGIPTIDGTAVDATPGNTAGGWTTIGTAYDSGSPGIRMTVVYRVRQAGDPSSVTIAWAQVGNYATVVEAFQKDTFDPATPIEQAAIQNQAATSTSFPLPSMTTTVRGLPLYFASNRSTGTWSMPGGLINHAENPSTANIATAYATASSAHTESPTATHTASTGAGNTAIASLKSFVPASGTTATPTEATGSGTANDATVSIKSNATGATATGTAYDATVDTTSFITGGNTGNSTGPSVTFPSTIASGQVITLMLMLNNTDNISASPTELTTLDSMALSGSGQGTGYLYRMLADGTTASSTLSWTLAATRNWTIAYVAHSDVDQDPANPYVGFNSASDVVTATTSFTSPSATSSGTGYALEFMGVKGDGTALGNFTAPSGWTERQQVLNTNTFGSNIAIATRNGNPVAAGTYGGDVWTTDVSATTSFRYTIILPQTPGTAAATGDALVYDATVSVTAVAAEATATGTAAWDAGDTVDSVATGDNPIFATGTAYDATVSTAVITTATPTSADAAGAANDGTALVVPTATGATGAGAAADGTTRITPAALEATGAGTAADAAAALTVPATEATGTGAGNDATVATSAGATATPTEATATGTAADATVLITISIPEAAATGLANGATAALAAAAVEAVAAATGLGSVVAVTSTPATATGTVTVLDVVARAGAAGGGTRGGRPDPRATGHQGPHRARDGRHPARPTSGDGPAKATSSTAPPRATGG